MALPTDKNELNELLKTLRDFPKIPLVQQLRKQFESQIKIIEAKETKAAKKVLSRAQKVIESNIARATKM